MKSVSSSAEACRLMTEPFSAYSCKVTGMIPDFVKVVGDDGVAIQVQETVEIGLLPQPQFRKLVLIPLRNAFASTLEHFNRPRLPSTSLQSAQSTLRDALWEI